MKSSESLYRSGGPAEISSQLDRLTEWRDRARTARVNWAQGAQAEAIRAAYRDGVKAASMVLRKAGHVDLAEKVTQLEKA
jgi:hypothetical protein